MILEVAFLNVRGGQTEAFEEAFSLAQEIMSTMPGYVSHQLQRCVEELAKYLFRPTCRLKPAPHRRGLLFGRVLGR